MANGTNYGYGDLSGLFGDKYSTQATLNDALLNEAASLGQLSSYGMGQASTYFQAAGGGTPLGSMLTQHHPMMKRQNLLDELQKKHPDPDTPEELFALAEDLGINGFGDLAMKVRQAAMELQAVKTSSAAAKLTAETPSDSAFKRLQTSLSNKIVTKEMIHGYMQHGGWNSTDGETYGKFGTSFKMESVEDDNAWYNQYKKDYAEAKAELEGEVENWAIDYQAQGSTKQILNQMLLNPDMQVIEFEKFVDIKGNTAAGKFLKDQTFVISSVKKQGLKEKENNDQASLREALSGAPDFPVPNLTNTNQTMAMNQEPRTWMDDIMEIYA
tara:strand:- start:41 stop:1021 length:981 start_codon:yes stop_codon:yes gene_type:complete